MIKSEKEIKGFLSGYDATIIQQALILRKLILDTLPGITEQIDEPANMIAYCYSQKYIDLICVIMPSKKGLKLGFNRGTSLPDPENLLEGKGKISRYVQIKSIEQIHSSPIKSLIESARALYGNLKSI